MLLAVSAAASRVRASYFLGLVWQLSLISWFQSILERAPEGAHGWIRCMREPPRLHHHIIQHSANNVWFSSIQNESDGDQPPLLWRDGAQSDGGGRWGLIVVKARPWEEEHGKILEMKHVAP